MIQTNAPHNMQQQNKVKTGHRSA